MTEVLFPPVIVACPCGVILEIPVRCELQPVVDGVRELDVYPDYVDLYAHIWTHE